VVLSSGDTEGTKNALIVKRRGGDEPHAEKFTPLGG